MDAYFDCFSGISGDMTLGALVDLGVPVAWLSEQLAPLLPERFEITVERVSPGGLQARQVRVDADDGSHHRDYTAIRGLIDGSGLPHRVKSRSLDIFQRLAEAEAGIHGCPPERVHFHEVGGVDAIVDVVGTALGLAYLEIEHVSASPLPLGRGFVDCHHGRLPVPAPATLALLQGVPVRGTEIAHELVTPTGAAIIASLAESFGPMPLMNIARIGYGAGHTDLGVQPNLLRVLTGQWLAKMPAPETDPLDETVMVVETTVDDMSPEVYGYLMERLFEDGALDVCWIPVFMKKNRPGTLVQVLCRPEHLDAVTQRILAETTSIGLRYTPHARRLLAREQIEMPSRFGPVPVKRVSGPAGEQRWVPEYEICRRIARDRQIPLRRVYDQITRDVESAADKSR